VKDKDRQVLPSLNGDADLPEQLWLYDDFTAEEDQPAADYAAGLASVGFIGAALRRSKWLWCGAAALGLICGLGFNATSPPAYQAQTTVLITHSPGENPVDAMQTDATLAESRTVAERAMKKLGVSEDVGSFIAAETITPVTDRVLLIKVSATSSRQAILRADALATAFLQFRAGELQAQQQLTVASLDQQVSQAAQSVSSISAQISKVSAEPQSDAQQAQLKQLNRQHEAAENAMTALQQTTAGDQAGGQSTVTSEVKGSVVLDQATPIHRSSLKYAVIYSFVGLFAGLVLGLAFVTIRALVSDRLRRRDDIADALGTPISLSTGPVTAAHRWLPSWPRARATRARDLDRAVMHLRNAVSIGSARRATLAVVTVDNEKSVAQIMVALAESIARGGRKVVLTDLCPGAPAARQLGFGGRGVENLSLDGITLAVSVPADDDPMPIGPLRGSRVEASAADAYKSADVLLTLVSLDPSVGAESLPTWSSRAVMVVTAGRSSWLRLRAVSELVRLSGTTVQSTILVGADKTDDSLGTGHPDRARPPVSPVGGF
jgi:capsular polysaccharide biosynthesis protein